MSQAPRPAEPSFTCEGARGADSQARRRADVPMGRLEVERLSTSARGSVRAAPGEDDGEEPRLPQVRLRVLAEAVPLGTFAAELSRALGLGIVVSPSLVDLRVSLSLPETTAEELFRLLRVHYGVTEAANARLILLQDGEAVRRQRFETQELLVQVVPTDGMSAEQLAAAFCKQVATARGSATVIGDQLLLQDESDALGRFQQLLEALRGQGREAGPRKAAARP